MEMTSSWLVETPGTSGKCNCQVMNLRAIQPVIAQVSKELDHRTGLLQCHAARHTKCFSVTVSVFSLHVLAVTRGDGGAD